MNIKWNADKYTQDFSFVHKYGEDLIELITGEKLSVLDLGCGNGALTKKIADRGFEAVGVDASEDFLKIAEENYPDLCFYKADATNFKLPEKVDVVFSNAVFHWIEKEKHHDMLKCVYEVLKDEGQFIFELGGFGNNIQIHGSLKKIFAKKGLDYKMPFYFPTIGEYAGLLENAGFKVLYTVLFDRMTELKGENGLYDWIKMFVKTPFEGVDEHTKENIIQKAVSDLKSTLFCNGKWYSDYVRLRCKAVKQQVKYL